jgi:hypothetical protein
VGFVVGSAVGDGVGSAVGVAVGDTGYVTEAIVAILKKLTNLRKKISTKGRTIFRGQLKVMLNRVSSKSIHKINKDSE